MGRVGRIFSIFSSPTQVFEGEKESPNPWIPFAIVIIVVLVVVIVSGFALREVWIEKAMERIRDLPPDQQEQAMTMLEPSRMLISGALYSLLGVPLKMLVTAGIFTLLVPIVGGSIGFIPSLTAVAYANVISLIAIVIKLPIQVATKTTEVHTSLALFLLSSEDKGFIFRVATQADFFTLWSLYVLGLGLATLGGFEKKNGIVLTFVVWFLWTLIYASALGFLPQAR